MPAPKPWLETLTLSQLQRLAVLIGSACSGTKPVRIAGIREAITQVGQYQKPDVELSLLSIDMGIRNLAFTHIKAPVLLGSEGLYQYGKPKIEAWQRLTVLNPQGMPRAVRSGKSSTGEDGDGSGPPSPQTAKTGKESFEPIDFAMHAYKFIDHMLTKYKPNQILIERQRFRTGGQAAVQEWTIRVGVFEGMLYAVLRTLAEERKLQLQVEPISPGRVNRSWLQDSKSPGVVQGKRSSSRDVKQAKIRLVCEMLEEKGTKSHFTVSKHLRPFTDAFLSAWKKETRAKKFTVNGIGKLDDLADSLLQGLAWINWQNNRVQVTSLGEEAFDLERS
ncbi:uncharacterized protein A1O9_03352 [Exophiala aquamarina CBS 119918]|uniref:Mitochondrial resolvase Ydc2 catalytic domain-containing protein n=1 Tax=Exophiala aquamarina CBS 119918 TaxID=1182545 RepID=A0A072PQ14_9EURO|nr:uncharacterized protein A1O9_03352 [Exophiala aquamarina CBS 119918]KEF61782.1 hypothetical protein A1O9_03352 [Exophiala aquamarina CBS 119918]